MNKVLAIAGCTWMGVVRKKDVYVLLILLASLLMVLISLNFFGLSGVVIYIMDIGLLMAWVFSWILGINVASREIPQEEIRGTIFPLLAKPVSRGELLVGKWLGAWSAVSLATLLFYCMILTVVLSKGGMIHPLALIQAFILHSAAIAIMCALSVALSTRLNNDAAATLAYIVSAASFAVVPRIPAFLTDLEGWRNSVMMFIYLILPHFEVFDMRRRISFNYGPASWSTFLLILAYAALVVAFLMTAAWLAYRHKRFSRDSLASV